MTKTAYIDRVKKGIELYTAMEALKSFEALKDCESLSIEFGNRGTFDIKCHEWERVTGGPHRSYSISDGQLFGRSMNIDMEKSGKSYLYCYTYDLFQNETHSKLYFEHITIKDGSEQDS